MDWLSLGLNQMSAAGLALALLPAELVPGRECLGGLGDPFALLLAAIHSLGVLVLLLPVDVAVVPESESLPAA